MVWSVAELVVLWLDGMEESEIYELNDRYILRQIDVIGIGTAAPGEFSLIMETIESTSA